MRADAQRTGFSMAFRWVSLLPTVLVVIFGAIANDHVAELTDINARETLVLGVLAIAVFWMGLYPAPFTEIMHVSVGELLKHLAASKL